MRIIAICCVNYKLCAILAPMNAQDKQLLFEMLHKISDNYYGFSAPDFPETVQFYDDALIALPADRPLPIQPEPSGGMSNAIAPEQYAPSLQAGGAHPVPNAAAARLTPEAVPSEPAADAGQDAAKQLTALAEKIKACGACKLCGGRTNAVPGMGVPNPAVMVIGEGPGEEEDRQGLPFVGPAGRLLDKMLNAIELDRNANCFIANVVKCRPPRNRDPEEDESAACRSFLDAQIAALKPKMILAVGRIASQNILNTDSPLGRLRGQFHEYRGIPLLVTYHPSALLRNEDLKRPAWDDLKRFRAHLATLAPDYAAEFRSRRGS